MSDIVKVTVPNTLREQMRLRAEKLGMTTPEYLRTLASLDVTTQNYQEMAICVNLLYNQIVDYQKALDIHCMPVQEVPIVKIEELI